MSISCPNSFWITHVVPASEHNEYLQNIVLNRDRIRNAMLGEQDLIHRQALHDQQYAIKQQAYAYFNNQTAA